MAVVKLDYFNKSRKHVFKEILRGLRGERSLLIAIFACILFVINRYVMILIHSVLLCVVREQSVS